MNRLHRVAAAGAMTALTTLAFAGHAIAHANSIVCVDQATSTWRVVNDFPLAESFTSPQGPSGTVAAGNGSYTDVVYVGDSLQIDAVWTDGFTESRTGTGDCTPEGGTTTTTELVTTTTEQETTISTTTQPASTSTSTTMVPASSSTSTSTTMVPASSSTSTSTTSLLVATTSTTSPEASTTSTPGSTTTTSTVPPTTPTSTTSPPPPSVSSVPPECSDNPNTPTDDCAPILPPTGFIGGTLLIIAGCLIGVGLLIGLVLRRKS